MEENPTGSDCCCPRKCLHPPQDEKEVLASIHECDDSQVTLPSLTGYGAATVGTALFIGRAEE